MDRSLPITKIDALTDLLDRTLTQERLIAQLSTFFGALAVLLAAVGLYGVLSYSVAQRTNEIGICMALGARGGSLLGMVMRETLLVVAMGTGLGVRLAIALARLIASRLYGLQPADPLTIVLASALLAVVAMLAGYVPARRAAARRPADRVAPRVTRRSVARGSTIAGSTSRCIPGRSPTLRRQARR